MTQMSKVESNLWAGRGARQAAVNMGFLGYYSLSSQPPYSFPMAKLSA